MLIESSGISEPMQVSETFFVDLGDGKGRLQEQSRLDNCVTVVDASALRLHLQTDDDMKFIDPRAQGKEAEQHISSLLIDQIEFANVILLNKVDNILPGASKKKREEEINVLTGLIRTINKAAKIIPTQHCDVDVIHILNTNNFSLEFANGKNRWMEDIRTGVKHVPETLEYGVSSFVYKATRALHPQRFYDWITRYFIFAKGHAEGQPAGPMEGGPLLVDESREQVTKRRAARIAKYGDLYRCKGFVYLGNPCRVHFYAFISQSGNTFTLSQGSFWDDFPVPASGESCSQEEGQQLVFIGQNLKKDALQADLEACLLTKKEEKQLAAALKKDLWGPHVFPDPLPLFELPPESEGDNEEDEEGS